MTTPQTLKTVSVLGMRLVLVAFLAAAGHAQVIVEELRSGNADAVAAALLALPTPDQDDLNGLLALMQAGKGGKSPAPEVAELAYAVIGWWSIQDAGIANGLLDRFENRDWPKLEKELFELATIGATDGMQRAAKWYAGKDLRLRRESLRLLRCVGGDKRLIDTAIKETLQASASKASAAKTNASKADVARALHLMWEFQVASEDLRKLLEARVAASESWDDKMLCVWAMVRGGAFRTDWLMQLYLAGNANQRRCIDDAMVMAADAVLTRLINALPTLTDDASRQIVIDWLAERCDQRHVRAGLRAVAPGLDAAGKRMIAAVLASPTSFKDRLPPRKSQPSSNDPDPLQSRRRRKRLPNTLPSQKAAACATQLANGKLTVAAMKKKLQSYEHLGAEAVPLLLLAKARSGRADWCDLVHTWSLTPDNTQQLMLPRLLVDLIHQAPMTEREAGIKSMFSWGAVGEGIAVQDGKPARKRPLSPRDGDYRLLSELGAELQPALPLLQWLAPRRATWFRDVLPKAPLDKPGK